MLEKLIRLSETAWARPVNPSTDNFGILAKVLDKVGHSAAKNICMKISKKTIKGIFTVFDQKSFSRIEDFIPCPLYYRNCPRFFAEQK